ncbi:hypothetical protein Csa_008959 [Cucumis sativus]|uniref:Uncharacterized protein n=1 Tax=Cucumis sativus TaxID=3659 RepID=A0A0A0KTZ6_CUCSA|nr:hypothetical protein Csa_008959 [Cucumis sativus]
MPLPLLHDFNVVITHLLVQYVFILDKNVGSKPICFPELGWSSKNGRPNLQASHCWAYVILNCEIWI